MSVTLEVSEALIAAVSPKISIIENAAGFTITIQDVLGTKTIDIKNGKDGDPGEQGEKGNGIEGAKFNDDYSLTLNYTNGETYTTPSLKGKDGIGIVGIELRESVPDEYDTYAIVLDDGNETLFKVPNVTIDGYLVKIEDKKNEAITEIENLKESIPSDYTEMSRRVEKAESDVTELKGDLAELKENGTGDKLEWGIPYDGEIFELSTEEEPAEPVPCTSITLNQTSLSFSELDVSTTLTATALPSDTTDQIVWSTDNETVATVKKGVVTAIANGTCNITATCGEQTATCAVTVKVIISYSKDSLEGYWDLTAYEDDYLGELTNLVNGGCLVATAEIPDITSGFDYAYGGFKNGVFLCTNSFLSPIFFQHNHAQVGIVDSTLLTNLFATYPYTVEWYGKYTGSGRKSDGTYNVAFAYGENNAKLVDTRNNSRNDKGTRAFLVDATTIKSNGSLGQGENTITMEQELTPEEYHHYVVEVGASSFDVYIDGEHVGGGTAINNSSFSKLASPLNTELKMMRVYHKLLTATEVANNYQNTMEAFGGDA